MYARAQIGEGGEEWAISSSKSKTKLPHLSVPRKILAGFHLICFSAFACSLGICMFPPLQRLRDIISDGVVSCKFGYWNFSGKGYSTTEESLRRYNNSSGIATRTKSPPPPYEDIPVADRNKRSRSGLPFDPEISGAQKICEKNTPEFRGHSLSKKNPEKFRGHSKFLKKAPDFRGHNTSICYRTYVFHHRFLLIDWLTLKFQSKASHQQTELLYLSVWVASVSEWHQTLIAFDKRTRSRFVSWLKTSGLGRWLKVKIKFQLCCVQYIETETETVVNVVNLPDLQHRM